MFSESLKNVVRLQIVKEMERKIRAIFTTCHSVVHDSIASYFITAPDHLM